MLHPFFISHAQMGQACGANTCLISGKDMLLSANSMDVPQCHRGRHHHSYPLLSNNLHPTWQCAFLYDPPHTMQAKQYNIAHGPLHHMGFALTRASVVKLNTMVVDSLNAARVPAVGLSPFASGWSTSSKRVGLGCGMFFSEAHLCPLEQRGVCKAAPLHARAANRRQAC